jgi:hypothetical protein
MIFNVLDLQLVESENVEPKDIEGITVLMLVTMTENAPPSQSPTLKLCGEVSQRQKMRPLGTRWCFPI